MTSILVLCGGQGTRLGETGRRRQKTMLTVGGTPLLELVLAQLCPAIPHATTITLLTGHRGSDVTAAVSDWQERIDPRIQAVAEHTPGAAGVSHIAARLSTPVLIVAGNVLLPYHQLLPRMLHQYEVDGRPVTAGSRRWRTTSHHTLTARDTTVTSWHRLPHRDQGEFEVIDSYLLTPPVLRLMRAGPEPVSHTRALATLVRDRAVAFCELSGDWLHAETLADFAVAPSRRDYLCRCPSWSSSPAHPEPERAPWPVTSPLS